MHAFAPVRRWPAHHANAHAGPCIWSKRWDALIRNFPIECLLHKYIYGLQQSPHSWYEKLNAFLVSIRIVISVSDSSMIFQEEEMSVFILVYVNDIIITGSSTHLASDLIHKLARKFRLKHVGNLFFLGMELTNMDSSCFMLSQYHYISDLLHRTNMEASKPTLTPIVTTTKLSSTERVPLINKFVVNKLC